jgi:hypothetical protein
MIEFETSAHQENYEKVKTWLKEIFGECLIEQDSSPGFAVRSGSSLMQVYVKAWGDDDATISCLSVVVTGAEITPELTRHLLLQNAKIRFGAFSIDSDDDILFDHSIIGSSCSKQELKLILLGMLGIADEVDDEIVSRWGGQRAKDVN